MGATTAKCAPGQHQIPWACITCEFDIHGSENLGMLIPPTPHLDQTLLVCRGLQRSCVTTSSLRMAIKGGKKSLPVFSTFCFLFVFLLKHFLLFGLNSYSETCSCCWQSQVASAGFRKPSGSDGSLALAEFEGWG